MWLYYITDRKQLGGTPAEQSRRLLDKISEAAHCGVDLIQLREKDLSSRELEDLARDAVAIVRQNSLPHSSSSADVRFADRPPTRLLINSRLDVAIAVGADGVHLPAHDIAPLEARMIWDESASLKHRPPRQALIGVSCHSLEDVCIAESQGADFGVFAPVFEKLSPETSQSQPGTGLAALRNACEQLATDAGRPSRKKFPVFALGGVTLDNAVQCLHAGAAGIAGIRLFQQNDIQSVVDGLRTLE